MRITPFSLCIVVPPEKSCNVGTFYPPFAVVHLQKSNDRQGEPVATCEDQLIERARHGDQEAFRQLWETHHAVAMAAALRLAIIARLPRRSPRVHSCSPGVDSCVSRPVTRFVPG